MTQPTLGLIGLGAFGAFALPHLVPHFAVVVHDPDAPQSVTLDRVARCDIVLLAVPVQKMESVLRDIAPQLKPGSLVLDVGSVKMKPAQWMRDILPATVDAVGLHPLFGPQSGKDGIAGLNVAVCNVRGDREQGVAAFLRDTLKLNVFVTSPEDHDRQLAYVQGLTHLLAKVIVSLDLPQFQFTTRTYELIDQAVGFIRNDSDELFKAIERENPFTTEAKQAFFAAARRLEEKLARD